ncbi:MAG TPA: hypothetical protein VKF82_06220 [Candidatus Eremiobacteraceae bacterium]|nr:hypothetical protein [Candidatus Eremiobacteraceae bacterium]
MSVVAAPTAPPGLIAALTIGLLVLVVAVRVVRMTAEQRYSPTGMWTVTVLFAAVTAWFAVFEHLTSAADIAIMLAAFAAGMALGWYQGTHTRVRVDRAARAMFVKVSPIGAIIFVAVLALRFGMRFFSGGFSVDPSGMPAAAPGSVGLISVALLALAVGMNAGVRAYLQRIYSQTP